MMHLSEHWQASACEALGVLSSALRSMSGHGAAFQSPACRLPSVSAARQEDLTVCPAMNAPRQAVATFTNEQFERLVRSGGLGDMRVELRRGLIVKMSPQYVAHATVKRLMAKAIEAALGKAGLDWIVDQELSVSFANAFEPMPDIVVWDATSAPVDLKGPVPASAVRLIVEVADFTLADDLGEKLEDYAAGGLAEYWVADVQGRLVLRHSGPQAATYAKREPARFGETIAALTIPALEVDTSALLIEPFHSAG
ncbi:MAG TPA: Uma2 family endonuclease [Gammaproteobacteria bacterium]|nr:Uma2 family endonuclease [Gammaproteobacteria bacterium]